MNHAAPPDADAAFHRALQDHESGRVTQAEAAYRAILADNPRHAESLHLLGLITVQCGDAEAGAAMIRRAMALAPGRAPHHNSLALALRRLGRRQDAVSEYWAALASRPDSAEIHNNLAATLRDLGEDAQAVAHYRRAAALAPGAAEIWSNLAVALAEQGLPEEADACFRRAIALRPDFAPALANHGRWLVAQGRWAEAEGRLEAAVRLAPDQAPAWINLGVARQERGRLTLAEAAYRQAIALCPDAADAHYNLGCLLHGDGRTDEAVACHRAAVEADPLHGAARLAACMALLPILYDTQEEIAARRGCYRSALNDLVSATRDPAIARAVAAAIGSSQPFFLPYQGENDRDLQTIHGRLASRLLAGPDQPALALPPAPGERIRLGVVSGFFQDHTIFRLFLEGWLTQLDRTRFSITGFHTGRTADACTARAASLCDRFVQDSPAWREAVLEAAPHVLLYPEIGMDPVSARLAAQRLAPVQCVTWGHPETTGLPTIDYFLSSELMEPPDGETHYAERLVRLAGLGLYYVPDPDPPPPADRASLGLSRDGLVYWSGQALYKYLPQYDSVFPRIASIVGQCQFVFIGFAKSQGVTEAFRHRLRRAFAAFGLDANQYCVFLPPMPQDRFLAAVAAADVILDTPGWSGGKSTLDGLARTRPIVTWPGPLMRGRHTAAILRAIGCEDTIADTIEDYVTIAIQLGFEPAWRATLRDAMARGKHRAFRDAGYIRALEAFLAQAVAERVPAGGGI